MVIHAFEAGFVPLGRSHPRRGFFYQLITIPRRESLLLGSPPEAFPPLPTFFAGNLREVRSVPATRSFPSKILAGNPGEPGREGNVVPAQISHVHVGDAPLHRTCARLVLKPRARWCVGRKEGSWRIERAVEDRRLTACGSTRANPQSDAPEEEVLPTSPRPSSSEADPFSDAVTDADPTYDEEGDGDDLVEDNAAHGIAGGRDYRRMEELDEYEREGLDDEANHRMDPEEARRARESAEEEMRRRDLLERRRGRSLLPGALVEDDEEDMRPTRRQRLGLERAAAGDLEGEEEDYEDIPLKLEEFTGPLREWLQNEPVRREVAKRFRNFLHHFTDHSSETVYNTTIAHMCRANKQSLEVSYLHLSHAAPILAIWVADIPKVMLEIFHEVAKQCVLRLFPDYERVHKEIFVRITHLPIVDNIRDIRQGHLNGLVKIAGVVTRRTGVFPQLAQVKYDCLKCGFTMGPFYQNSEHEVKPGSCPDCQSLGPFSINVEQTLYRNYQKITLQESPGSIPAGRLPRYKEVILLHDQINCARPGEEVEVTGIYTNSFDASLNTKNGFPVFNTVVEANYVSKKEDMFSAYRLTDDDKTEIHKLSRDPRIATRIMKSIAPSIYGHENIKAAIALSMFGGQEKNVDGKHRLRGDINVLLLGDPGTAKSQFLKYVEKTAMRSVYTTGKGASAVGLTAAVHKDPITREWTLEGGALVLADRGVCLIDEFDKMNDQDRVSIHEAMEQQTISISKAGIVTSLQARCAVIAAANPIGGRYDSSRNFAENVELTEPILSRFDVLCVVKDIVDPVTDERLAQFVVGSHVRSHPENGSEDAPVLPQAEADDRDLIPQDLLRKYITYAKQYVRPKLLNTDFDKISRVYAELRRASVNSHGVPIAVRHIESLIRMSEAHARMHLREYVKEDDIDVAIRTLLTSFVSTQRYGVQKSLERSFHRYINYKKDFNDLLLYILRALVRDTLRYQRVTGAEVDPNHVTVNMKAFAEKAKEYNLTDLESFYQSPLFAKNHFKLDRDRSQILFSRSD